VPDRSNISTLSAFAPEAEIRASIATAPAVRSLLVKEERIICPASL
jgi:hypothetical protein